MKHEWKKHEKGLYGPGTDPVEIAVPEMGFFALSGEGNPNSPEFARAIETLYGLSYGVRMSEKNGSAPSGFYEYTVYPLEGVWGLADPSKYVPGARLDKDNLAWKIMVRQPDFVDGAFAREVQEKVARVKKLPQALDAVFFRQAEGRCVQVLHRGSYDSEPASFQRMEDFCRKESLARRVKEHREIYLTNALKTAPDKLITILRWQVRDDFSCI